MESTLKTDVAAPISQPAATAAPPDGGAAGPKKDGEKQEQSKGLAGFVDTLLAPFLQDASARFTALPRGKQWAVGLAVFLFMTVGAGGGYVAKEFFNKPEGGNRQEMRDVNRGVQINGKDNHVINTATTPPAGPEPNERPQPRRTQPARTPPPAPGAADEQTSQQSVKHSNDVIQVIGNNHSVVKFTFVWPTVVQAARNQADPAKGTAQPYQLLGSNLDDLEKLLAQHRGTPRHALDPQTRASCATAAALLRLGGRPVGDLDRWLDRQALDAITRQVEQHLAVLGNARAAVKEQSTAIMLAADTAADAKDFGRAIGLYETYVDVMRKLPVAKEVDPRAAQEEQEVVLAAMERLGVAYLTEAENLKRRDQQREAEELRGKALLLYQRIAAFPSDRRGASITIAPDEKGRPRQWLIHEKVPAADVKVEREGLTNVLRLRNQAASFLCARLLEVDRPDDYQLKWRWKLTEAAAGYRDPKNGYSLNHPLSLIVAFLRPDNNVVALHYVQDPLEPVGKRWIDPDNDPIRIGFLKFQTVYPHIVVADKNIPIGKWQEYTVDPAADYRKFFNADPPPIRAVIVGSNCQFADPGVRNRAEGLVADIRLEAVPKKDVR